MQLNREHTYGALLDEQVIRGQIDARDAREDYQRKALTSYIGMGQLKQIDRNLSPVPVGASDTILLMSDGVFGTLDDEEICRAMEADSAAEAAGLLGEAVSGKQKKNQDNYTAVILRIS